MAGVPSKAFPFYNDHIYRQIDAENVVWLREKKQPVTLSVNSDLKYFFNLNQITTENMLQQEHSKSASLSQGQHLQYYL